MASHTTASGSPPKHYPVPHSSSSAFSASANPNEDWTKISDLAERRRIQNRIAQRNYRKKLKKRLEDLERRASFDGSSPEQKDDEHESPEQQYVQVAQPVRSPIPAESTQPSVRHPHERRASQARQVNRGWTPDVLGQQYVLPTADGGMFSQQFTRQMSTSPPPWSYSTRTAAGGNGLYTAYAPAAPYCTPNAMADAEMALYSNYLAGNTFGAGHNPIKPEFGGDDDLSPFAMSYASMAGMDMSSSQPLHDLAAYTPSLSSESWEFAHPDSPPDMLPLTPPLGAIDHF